MPKTSATLRRKRRVYVQHFADFHKKLNRNEAISWIRVPTSLLVCDAFATLSLQTRGVFASLLLLCGLNSSAEISININYLSNVLSCDKRTLENALKELLENELIFEIDTEKEKERETHTAKPERKKSKKETANNAVDFDCPLCSGNNETVLGGRLVPCPRCAKVKGEIK